MKEQELDEKELVDVRVKKSKGWNWGMIVVGMFAVLVLAGLSAPMTSRCRKAGDRTQAINNAKQVGLALLEFDQEFGSFPDETTVAMVKAAYPTELDLSGTSSNAMFRQLIALGIQSEDIFYCLHPEGIRKPDGKLTPGKALEAGEVGWSYVMLNKGIGQSTSGNSGRAVLAAPMKIGTEQFWERPFQGKGIILRLDSSVEAASIRKKDGKLSTGSGKTLFGTGPETVWGTDGVIDLRHPEPGE